MIFPQILQLQGNKTLPCSFNHFHFYVCLVFTILWIWSNAEEMKQMKNRQRPIFLKPTKSVAAFADSNMSEKLCLKWNDFQENVNAAFGNLREDNEFADVTLACEDGQQIEAHKVILAASSPFFQTLLRRNRHPHPLIYMRGVKSENLQAIVDFLYCGEANVFQDNLDSFLAIAEELKLKGLMGQNDVSEQNTEENPRLMTPLPRFKREKLSLNPRQNNSFVEKVPSSSELNKERRIAVSNLVSGDNLQELDEKVKSMMEKSQIENRASDGKRAYTCKVCGKEGQWVAIRDHIEANHLEGVFLPCNVCGKECRSRNNLRRHKCSQN